MRGCGERFIAVTGLRAVLGQRVMKIILKNMIMIFNKLIMGSAAVWLAVGGIVESGAAEVVNAGKAETGDKVERMTEGAGEYSSPYSQYQGQEVHFRAPGVPREMVFAGDTVRFGRSDLYERMDRELISFTYMHSNSILMLKKSDRYFGQVEPILRKFGVPDDLKYLMAIESNLNPKAYSSAGAAGLWQFTKATGKEYGLIIDGEVDERYNIEKETEAACKYLKKAYEKYGDWMTVAASYNAGQGGISRRLEGQRQKTALNLWMVEETSRYMFRVLAAKMFFENPEAFGFRVEMFEKYPYRSPKEVVTVTGSIADLVDFAEEHGVSYFQLKEANLWLRDSKLLNKSGHTYRIIIPDGK